jgi:environmental stress-induced protein Ves
MAIRILRTQDAPVQSWRNGGGQTRELLTWKPADRGDWHVRISVATVERDGPFSSLPGVQRWLALLDGGGACLRWADRQCTIAPGDLPLHFEGEPAPYCRLLGQPTRDLNLMTRAGSALMTLVRPGTPFRQQHAQCGLYVPVAGTMWDGALGVRIELPAHTLLWDDAPGRSAYWRFEASGVAAPATIGFWLGFTPANRGGDLTPAVPA